MISVCIPAFNESERLPSTMAEIENFIRENPGLVREVVIVDDGSKDATVEVAMRWLHRMPLKVERLAENSGKWAAVRHGIKCATNDAVLLLDADGSASIYELENVPNLRDKLKVKTAVFGSRFLKDSRVDGKSVLRKFVSWGYKVYGLFWYWFATGKRNISDSQCPFKIIYKSKLDIDEMIVNRFAGDIEMCCYLNTRIVNQPVNFIHKAGSKLPFSAIFSMAYETVEVALRYRKWKKYYRNE